MKLYLIRHGQTYANEQHLYCGSTDIPLSENGKKMLEAKKYSVEPECRFIVSGMLRTIETLKLLFGNIDFEVDERLKEIDFGVFEMKSYEQLKNDAQYQQWITGDNENNVPPCGESGNMVKARVVPAIKDIIAASEDAVVITHGGVISIIMEYLFPDENKNRYQWQPKQGEGYLVEDDSYSQIE